MMGYGEILLRKRDNNVVCWYSDSGWWNCRVNFCSGV